jgi:hypothetical protein
MEHGQRTGNAFLNHREWPEIFEKNSEAVKKDQRFEKF